MKYGMAIGIVIVLLMSSLIVADYSTESQSADIEKIYRPSPGRAQTHVVFGELLTATWCTYCPSASDAMAAAQANSSYEFYYVSMIEDVNDKAHNRSTVDYTVTGYPTAMFDGGYEEAVGGQSDSSNYESLIQTCGERTDVVPLTMEQTAYKGDIPSEIKITVKVKNDGGSIYSGKLRTYITEKVSRYNRHDGNPYKYGFLDFAIDKDISINPGESQVYTVSWVGSEASDSQGNNFGDIDYSNIEVFSAVFNSQPHVKRHEGSVKVFTAYYVDQAVASDVVDEPVDTAEPTVSIKSPINGAVVSGQVSIKATAEDDTGVRNVSYYVDGKYMGDMSFTAGVYTAIWDSKTVKDGTHTITVKAMDNSSNTGKDSIKVEVLNIVPSDDTTPPTVEIVTPSEGDQVDSDFTLKATAKDDTAIDIVKYRIDSGNWIAMEDSGNGIYTAEITGLDEGTHTIEVEASDTSGNTASDSINITVKAGEVVDTIPPSVVILSPGDNETIYETSFTLTASVVDNDAVATVVYYVDGIEMGALNPSGTTYAAVVDISSLGFGQHILKVEATDASGNIGSRSITFTYEFKIENFDYQPKGPDSKDTVTFTLKVGNADIVDEVELIFSGSETGAKKMLYSGDGVYELETGPFPSGTLRVTARINFLDGNYVDTEELVIYIEKAKTTSTSSTESSTPGFEAMTALVALVLIVAFYRRD